MQRPKELLRDLRPVTVPLRQLQLLPNRELQLLGPNRRARLDRHHSIDLLQPVILKPSPELERCLAHIHLLISQEDADDLRLVLP